VSPPMLVTRTQTRRRAAAGGVTALIAALAVGACSADPSPDADLVAGKQQFVAKCGACHVLARAETLGTVGPNLDESFHQALADGMGRSGIEGMVLAQIKYPAILQDNQQVDGTAAMPADLVTGDTARDVAAYVASVAARGGEDQGRLADAVKKAGGGEPAVAQDGVLTIPADPGGQLAYVTNAASAPPGPLTVRSPNEASIPHNIVIDGKGEGEVVQNGGVSEFDADFDAGEYAFYCSVPGHREGGMEGTLTVE
jgi:plastocyanin